MVNKRSAKPFWGILFMISFSIMAFSILLSSIALAADAISARSMYMEAQEKISEMQLQGYPTQPLIDMLSESEKRYNLEDYNASSEFSEKVLANSDEIIALKAALSNLSDEASLLSGFGFATSNLEMEIL